MKRLAERGMLPRAGYYIGPCDRCGLRVVHSRRTREPVHMHRFSVLCRTIAQGDSEGLPLRRRGLR